MQSVWMNWKVSGQSKKCLDNLENVSGKSKKGLDDLEVCLDWSCGIGKLGSQEKSKNRKKSDKNRIKSDKKLDNIGKIGKIGFDLNSDSTALVLVLAH